MNFCIEIARRAVQAYLEERRIIPVPPDAPPEMLDKMAGVFVSIEKKGELRGCIGTYAPLKSNIVEEVIDNAIAAASRDSRFDPVEKEELPSLDFTVYVLGLPEPVENFRDLDPQKYGVLVKAGGKTGLLLPGLEGIDTSEKQISIACQKADIDPTLEDVKVYKFTADIYRE